MGCVQASLEDPRGFHRSTRSLHLLRKAGKRQVIRSAPSWASLRGLLGCQQDLLRPAKVTIRPSRHGEEMNWDSEVLERTVSAMGVQPQEAQLDYVLVTGAEAVLLPYMGTFFKSNLEPSALQAYRPIYQNVNGKQLYYRASWGLWLLSEGGVHESDVWMGRAYAKDDVECPSKARGWIVWDGTAWNTSYTLHVTETDGTTEERVETARPMQFLHEKQPPPPQRLSLREAEEALGLPRARELVAPLKQGLSVSAWLVKHGTWMPKTLKVDSRANFLAISDNEEMQEWRLQRIMVVLDGVAATNLCSLLNISVPESEMHLSVALHGSWEGAAKRENVLAFCCRADQDLPARLRAAVSLAPSPGAALRAAAKVLQAQQRFRAVRQDLKKRKEQRMQKAAGGLVSAQVKDAEALLNVASWPPSNVLELDLSLKTPGLQEMEKHSADIPAKFKPENALVIAEKIAAQVSEDVHVLDKELLTQEIKEILRLFRCFGNMPAKGYRGKLFMSDTSWSNILKEGDLIALHQSLQEGMTIRALRLCMMQRLHLEGVCHRLSEHAARTSRRVDPDLSLPLVLRSAELFGPRCRPRQMGRKAWGDAPVNLEVDQHLQGTWYYEPNGCFHIRFQDGILYFQEQIESRCYRGALQPEGVHFTAQLFDTEEVLQGTMRMRWVGDYLIANFRESVDDPWSPDILARRHSRESTTSSRSGRGPLQVEMQEKRSRNFSSFSSAFFEPKGVEDKTTLLKPEPEAGTPPTLEEVRLADIFRVYGRENHGFMDLQGLHRLCADLGYPVQREEAAQAMARLDTNRSGHCSFEEFKAWWMAPQGSHYSLPILDFLKFRREGFFSLGLAWPRIVDEARLREVFNTFDCDKSGFIDLQELRNVSAELGVTMTSHDVEAAMQELSPNHRKNCSFDDFRDWWMTHNTKNSGLLGQTFVKAGMPFGIPWLT